MRRSSRLAVPLAVIALAAPTAAHGQGEAPPLQDNPPATGTPSTPRATTGNPSSLPATGAEPAMLALMGAGLLLSGLGLRLRVREPLD
jgi:LPXTG-motif cell wall-anchored protein